MRHTFQAEQWLPFPVEQVFAFFANPENLPKLMPPWQKTKIEQASLVAPPERPPLQQKSTPIMSLAAGKGTHMILSFRPFPLSPIRIAWHAEISEFEWNDHFCDTQSRGPFAYWHHCHRIAPLARDGRDGSLLNDVVQYELPFGLLGEIARPLFAERQLRSTFLYRQEQTSRLLNRQFANA